jgi:hypothetical protein
MNKLETNELIQSSNRFACNSRIYLKDFIMCKTGDRVPPHQWLCNKKKLNKMC